MKKLLSTEFLKRIETLLGEEYHAFLESYGNKPNQSLNVNRYKIMPEKFSILSPFALEKISFSDYSFSFNSEKPGRSVYHHAGCFYVQEISAMMPINCLPLVNRKVRILDLCAAPGGKTMQLAQNENAFILANEINPKRAKILVGNIERLGLVNVIVSSLDAKVLAETYPGYFDYIILDAPCSGEGMFRKNPEAIKEWSLNSVLGCAERQKELLDYASIMLADQGHLLYSTCTFAPEENEFVIKTFLEDYPEYSLLEVPDNIKNITKPGVISGLEKTRRAYPHLTGEGQFMALMKKHGYEQKNKLKGAYYRELSRQKKLEIEKFLAGILNFSEDLIIKEYNGKPIIVFDSDFLLPPSQVFLPGVTIFDSEKNLVPHHQFFMTFGHRFKRKLNLKASDIRIKQYLKGLEIEADVACGFGALLVEGAALGGFKAKNNKLKNHYPKGLRENSI
ncbi:MAG: hypothetical protein FWE36_02840 [Erysipelotrichales bacterium]|nr:hypothetical protein [Erysipelotrichales bacterium]